MPVNKEIKDKTTKLDVPYLILLWSLLLPLISGTTPTLLAWCSEGTNKISAIDLETKQNSVTFDVARISDASNSCTHVKEILDTKLLVSLHSNYEESANMEIFDISKKGKANKIYSLGEVFGSRLVTGMGDVTYNSRRGILSTIPVAGRIPYYHYLFTINTGASNTKEIAKLNRKPKWHSQYSTQEGNVVPVLDFNPAGESIATTDAHGVCLIEYVDTNHYLFHL